MFKAGSTITIESGASVILANGAQAANVIWLVGSSFTSVATSTIVGNILANTSITLGGGTLAGRALAGIVTSSGAVTIAAANSITVPASGPVVVSDVASVGAVSIVNSAGVATITPDNPGNAVVEFRYPFAGENSGIIGGSFPLQNDAVYSDILVTVLP